MAKLNYQKLSYQSRLNSQPVINPPAKKVKTKKKRIKAQTLTQAVDIETTFIKGKYRGTNIGELYKLNKNYFIWVLENQPKGITAQQIILFFNKNPHLL